MLRRLPRLLLPRRRTPRAVLLSVLGHWQLAHLGRANARGDTRQDPGRLAVAPWTTTWPGIAGAAPPAPGTSTATRLAPPSSRRRRLLAAWHAVRRR